MAGRDRGDLGFLAFTAFVCGAAVMMVEVLGSRVIGPFFGVSLFVWTSLITVTLVALAAGYALGGFLSDRHEKLDVLYGIILAAGLLVLLIPVLKGAVLKASLPLGLRAGALTASLLLFGPPLLLLGCVSPYVVKGAVREIGRIGRVVGLFYAVSTVGSFVGTVMTGFVLITLFGVTRIFQATGGGLIVLAVFWFVFYRRKWFAAAALIAPLFMTGGAEVRELTREDGVRITVVSSRESYYGRVKVVDYDYGVYRTRELVIDGLVQGGVDMRNGWSIYGYPYFLKYIPRALRPGGKTCLVVGLGAGIVPRWYEGQGVRTDVLDIDPNVVAAAKDFFGYEPRGDVHTADARHFLRSTDKQWDYIILDVFSGDTTPTHVLSLEALEDARRRLAPGGLLAVNVIGSLREDSYMTASILKTFEEAFPHVRAYPAHDPAQSPYGNIIVVASASEIAAAGAAMAGRYVHPLAAPSVRGVAGRTFSFPPGTRAVVLTDDYNPVDFYDNRVKEALRADILRGTEADILL